MEHDTNTIIQDAFAQLHPVVQRTLTSADLGEKLRALSQKHALHLDKWTLLENEITMTLLGITDPDTLIENIRTHVGVTEDEARALANDAVETIFNPVRAELEAALTLEKGEGVHIPIEQKMALEATGETVPKSVTQEAPVTVASIVASRLSEAKTMQEQAQLPQKDVLPKNPAADSSHMRRTIENDPYREQV